MTELDGASLSFQHPHSGEWAHDVRDPLREASEVSVDPAWEWLPPRSGQAWSWIEVGFGRGLITATALRRLSEAGITPASLTVHGCEAFPERLAPWPELPESLRPWCPWWGGAEGTHILPGTDARLELVHEAAPACFEGGLREPPGNGYDWVFLDLFSPGKHADEWGPGLLESLTARTRPGGVLTTYTCARVVRDELTRLGWTLEILRRPGIRDTLRARLAPSGPPS